MKRRSPLYWWQRALAHVTLGPQGIRYEDLPPHLQVRLMQRWMRGLGIAGGMATNDWKAPGTLTTALSTELNSLADGSFSSASSAIDNTAQPRCPFMMLELNLASLSPAAGAYSDAWIEESLDGTNYADHGKALQTQGLLATWGLDTTASTAQRLPPVIVAVKPTKFKLAERNKAGVAQNASGNTLKYSLLTDESY